MNIIIKFAIKLTSFSPIDLISSSGYKSLENVGYCISTITTSGLEQN
jgi:hypothetical protein